MNTPEQPTPPRRPRWLVTLIVGLAVAVLTWLVMMLAFNMSGELSLVIAGSIGLLCGLLAGRYYIAAGAVGIVLETLIAAGAAIFGAFG